MRHGYRGFLREMAHTGSWRALGLQLRTGATHLARRLMRRPGPDPVALFLANYSGDGVRVGDPARTGLQIAAEACLVCGLCSAECARVGGAPALDPRDAVLAAARLEVDVRRLGLDASGGPCAGCRACERICPARIPISAIQSMI